MARSKGVGRKEEPMTTCAFPGAMKSISPEAWQGKEKCCQLSQCSGSDLAKVQEWSYLLSVQVEGRGCVSKRAVFIGKKIICE